MTGCRSAESTRTRRAVCRAAVALLIACAALASPAQAAARPAPRPIAQAAASSLAKDVCSLLGEPVEIGVNRLISWMTKGRIRGSFAGTLFNELGFQRWCPERADRLISRVRGVSQRRPGLRPRLGPFVSGVVASYGYSSDARYYRLNVSWREFTVSAPLRHYYVWYSLNGTRYQALRGKGLLIRPGNFVRFAVRVDNTDGISSPWIYSPRYQI